jgi:hypothetical protein
MSKNTNNTEELIEKLSAELAEIWYSAEDYGEDKFTEIWSKEHVTTREAFEATCYYAIQCLVYSDDSEDDEMLKAIAAARGFDLVKRTLQ